MTQVESITYTRKHPHARELGLNPNVRRVRVPPQRAPHQHDEYLDGCGAYAMYVYVPFLGVLIGKNHSDRGKVWDPLKYVLEIEWREIDWRKWPVLMLPAALGGVGLRAAIRIKHYYSSCCAYVPTAASLL